jgi:hypothetical protein
MKSVSKFASNFSQNYEFIATDKPRSVKVFQASFTDWHLFTQDRIFNVPSRVVKFKFMFKFNLFTLFGVHITLEEIFVMYIRYKYIKKF